MSLLFSIAHATHIMGVDIAYECIGGCTYRIHWNAYRDCGGVTGISPNVNFNVISGTNCTPPVPVGNWSAQVTTEVTPICPGIQTQCTSPGALIRGVQEYYRYRDYNICSANCIYQITWTDCCRNNAITSGSASQTIFTGQTTINTAITPCNSSPRFSNPPIPYICMGQPFTFNQGAYDSDGDSLVYSLGPCYRQNNAVINYNAGYSPTAPLGPSWTLNLDPSTGDLSITPSPGNLQVGVLCIYVEEYRNGVLIGQVVRDMQITVIDCGNNNLPQTTGVTNVVGGTGSGFSVSTCLGSSLCFDIPIVDLDNGQTVQAWWNQNIPGATFVQTGTTQADTISGNNPSATFCWTPPSVGTFTFLVSMEDDNCPLLGSNQYTFSISVNPPVTVSASALITCQSVQLTAMPNGGSGPFTYDWSGAGGLLATGINHSHTYPGPGVYPYTVTVTDANGCTGNFSGSVVIQPQVNASATAFNASCNGTATGSIQATASGGTGPYTYTWSGNQTGPSLSSLVAGSYSVTITDANGCSDSATATVNEPPALQVALSGTDPTCNGISDGTATAGVTGGTPGYTYLWSNGQTTPQATGLAAGTASVTVTDQNGCTTISNLALNAPSALSVNASSTQVSCHGGADGAATVSALGGSPGYTYLWSPNAGGATTAQITGLTAGNYSVTVTDQNGCFSVAPVAVAEPAAINLTASLTVPTCFGVPNGTATVQPSGGTPPFTYAWSNGQQTIAATSLTAGPYAVTVTDANGCSDSLALILTEPAALTLLTNAVPVSCNGGSDGTASATPTGGTPPYTFTWNNAQTTSLIGNLSAGAYTVTVADANGCLKAETVLVSEPAPLQVQLTGTDPQCATSTDGTASAVVSGGNPGYTYAWSGGQTAPQASNLAAGNHTVTVTDARGCTQVASLALNAPAPLALTATATAATCFGSADGTAAVTANGGTAGYAYVWSGGATTAQATGLPAGNYSVTVTDANGCNAVVAVAVGEAPPLNLQLEAVAVACYGEANGTATVSVQGGTPGYTYTWTGGQSSSTATALAAGGHHVQVIDANGCRAEDSIVVGTPDSLQVQISGPNKICLGTRADLLATVQGGNGGYQYSWTAVPGGMVGSNPVLSIGPTTDTDFQVVVTDAQGCSALAPHFVGVAPLPLAEFIAENTSGCDTVTAVFTNLSQGAIAYQWNFGDGRTATVPNPTHQFTNGTFDVTLVAISADGCRDSITKLDLVTVLPTPIAGFTTREDISRPLLLSNAELHFQNTSQFASTYAWEFGDGYISTEANPVHTYGEPGRYPVTLYAYNAFGCVDSITIAPILIEPDGVIYVPNAFTPNGDGLNDSFELKGEGIASYQFAIFNRWGEQVYLSRDINQSWDGTFHGNPSQEGVYIWKLEARVLSGLEVKRGGSLTLIR